MAYLAMIAIVVALITYIIWSLKERNNFWKKRGVPGPEPKFLYGNLRELLHNRSTKHEMLQEWTKKYGKVYGVMEGGIPLMIISDLDMVNEIFIKNFACFHARRKPYIDVRYRDPKMVQMFQASGSRWKRMRSISAPAFSTMRLKQIAPAMNSCIDNLMETVNASVSEGKNDFYQLFQNLTLNGISRCAFGFQPVPSKNKRDDFLSLCAQAFQDTVDELRPITYSKYFPRLRMLWSYLMFYVSSWSGLTMLLLEKKLKKIVKARKDLIKQSSEKSSKNVALIDILLDCEVQDTDIVDNSAMLEEEFLEQSANVIKKLYPQEILAQCALYMLAGYETTSNALSYTLYELARNPEAQETLRSEIFENFGSDEEINYENVSKLTYLDCVVKETLRLYPIAAWVVNRMCTTPCKVGDYLIEKGTSVCVDVWSIHYDKEIWGESADRFCPDRFYHKDLPHPMAWIPFGAGPRHCIGDRFAQLEMKLTLVRILKDFEFFIGPELKVPLELQEGVTTNPKHGLIISFKPL